MMHLNIINPQQMSFSCFHYIVTFLIAIQPWTWTARSGYAGLMTAAASVKSPGEMDPKTLSILIGDNANITCRLANPKSTDIWFLEEKSKRPIKQPSEQIMLLDDYTAVLMIHNAVEQNSRYQCKVGDNAIAVSELYVGTKPQNVTDFSCISYDYEYMECSFTRPKNMVLTKFNLEYKLPKDSSIYKCDCHDGKQIHQVKCNVTDYLPMREKYLFTLKGTNDVGENTQTFSINNHKIVIPSAVDIFPQNITSDSIAISLEKLKISYYIKIGLTYDIQIRDNNSNWRTPQTGELECQNGTCNIVISNLYAFWLYWIKVKVKSNMVDNDEFWSKEKIISFHTKSERPKRAPETPLGSFYIDNTETQLRLYWEQMPKYEYNGPGFHYVINEINEHGVAMLSTKTNESSLTFAWKNESMQMFVIKSANDKGESYDESRIRVYRSGSSRYELNENSIAKVYHNSSYTLSWSPPENVAELMNYTVFWCLPEIELPNQCKGPISYKYLGKLATNFTTEPKDRSLNLAISANYPHYNKGMQWARCSGEVSSELMKMELEVNALNESAILVKWSSGSVCASILKGYNLTYCHASMDDKCVTPQITVELLRTKKEYRNHTITDLPAYTNVCVNMVMYSSSKQGRISDWNCIRTKAMAPSPPKSIRYIKNTVTSKSAEIQWSPPDKNNGILSNYTIYWRKYPDHTFEKNTTSIEQTSYNLTGLNSYSNYEVYVTAHTIEESVPSKRINFTTLIGIPSGPRNLNIYENDTVIYWDQPDLPSGRHLFYIVALIRQDEKYNPIYERVSIVKGRSCRFQQPDCLNSNKTYALKVRAVNVGGKEEVDREIVAMNKDVILEGSTIDEGFCKSEVEDNSFDINTKSIFQNDNGKFYFASPWMAAPRSYSCSASSKASIYAVALIIVIAFAAYLCCWLRNKIYNMKNIKVILPEGLVTNYKYATDTLGNGSELGSSTKKEFHSDISRSNDCLVSYGHKENLNLITNFHNGSSNALSSLSSSNSSKDHHKEEQIGEHPSLETTNEELSSNSSSASNSNLTYHDHPQIKRLSSIDSNNTIPVSGCEEEEYDDGNTSKEPSLDNENVQNFTPQQNNGYVTHNSQLLASILNATERNVPTVQHFNPTFPTMINDGYIQPSAAKQLFQPPFSHHQPQPPTTINGYTCIESLGKLTTPDESRHINIPTSQTIVNSPVSNTETSTINTTPSNGINIPTTNVSSNILSSLHTSPVITDLNESPSAEYNKDNLQQNGTTVSVTSATQQPNNNNNTIYGYVTQQQLANFGTNVALGKELNT
ncbi:cytokine receptor-like [Calliphora vicina]|uniref:cytokine receptor-like n=1 Tax=Calliphora vicina TaxID=7373 RepID=UPI00325B7B97